jgi:hypothetical protein
MVLTSQLCLAVALEPTTRLGRLTAAAAAAAAAGHDTSGRGRPVWWSKSQPNCPLPAQTKMHVVAVGIGQRQVAEGGQQQGRVHTRRAAVRQRLENGRLACTARVCLCTGKGLESLWQPVVQGLCWGVRGAEVVSATRLTKNAMRQRFRRGDGVRPPPSLELQGGGKSLPR